MRNVLLVGIGGFIGSAARYWLSGVVTRTTAAARFPFGTLAVNLTGCLLMGVLTGLIERRQLLDHPSQLLLLTGILGGFTTFSAFAYETYFLGREHSWLAAVANLLLQVLLGLAVLWIGHRIAAG
jgi:CrcB protein